MQGIGTDENEKEVSPHLLSLMLNLILRSHYFFLSLSVYASLFSCWVADSKRMTTFRITILHIIILHNIILHTYYVA